MQGSENNTKIFWIRVSSSCHYALNTGHSKPLEELSNWERYEMHDILLAEARRIEELFPEVIGKRKDANPNHEIVCSPKNRTITDDDLSIQTKLQQAKEGLEFYAIEGRMEDGGEKARETLEIINKE